MKTLGELKLELMHRGVALSAEARRHPAIAEGLIRDSGDEEIVFSLAEDFFVRTFIQPAGLYGIPLEVREGRVQLGGPVPPRPVQVIPIPKFLREKKKNPDPVAANIGLDGYCLNLFLRKVGQSGTLNLGHTEVIAVIRAAFEEGAADLVQLNMDYCGDGDRGFPQLAPLIGLIKKNFRTFVALRGFPPEDVKVLDGVYAAGADLLVFPLEGIHNRGDRSFPLSPSKVLSALDYAAGVFSPGTVFTELAIASGTGRQPLSSKIQRLAGKGIMPVLQLPEKGIAQTAEYRRIAAAARELGEAVRKHKIPLKWLYPAGRLMTGLDTAFFTDPAEKARLAQRPIYKSTLGRTASEGFAALRRKLRVKDISDSYESAGL